MKHLISTALFIAVLTWTVSASAIPPKAELFIWKKDPFLYGPCGHCSDMIPVYQGDNYDDLRWYNFTFQWGHYEVDLMGPPGTTVTLFGALKHGIDKGFLIIKKSDGKPVSIADLEALPPKQWVSVPPSEPGFGAYSAWYQPYADFGEDVNSVQWGKWWNQLPPAAPPIN